jgi:hypothetical protein
MPLRLPQEGEAMKVSHVQPWRVCESCSTRVPSTWGEPTPDGCWLCSECLGDEPGEDDGPLEGVYSGPVHLAEGWE